MFGLMAVGRHRRELEIQKSVYQGRCQIADEKAAVYRRRVEQLERMVSDANGRYDRLRERLIEAVAELSDVIHERETERGRPC